MNKVINGSDLMLFVESGGKTESLAFATTCVLNLALEAMETSSKDSGKWVENQGGKLSWSGSSDNLLDGVDSKSLYARLFKLMTSRETITISLTLAKNADSDLGMPEGGWLPDTSQGLIGKAIITGLDLNAPDKQNSTLSISLTGTGALVPQTEAAG